jgi:hypothetical protein
VEELGIPILPAGAVCATASAAVGVPVRCICECGEEADGPVFGLSAGIGVNEADVGLADVEAYEFVGEPHAVDVLELE